MPEAFNKCRAAGGKIRTKTINASQYQHECILPGGRTGPRGGRTVGGEIKTKKAKR